MTLSISTFRMHPWFLKLYFLGIGVKPELCFLASRVRVVSGMCGFIKCYFLARSTGFGLAKI